MLTQSLWGKKAFLFHGEGGLYLGGLSAVSYEEGSICFAAIFWPLDPTAVLPGHGYPVWHLCGLLSISWKPWWCPGSAMLVILRILHFVASLSQTWVFSGSQEILASTKPRKLWLPSLHHLRMCASLRLPWANPQVLFLSPKHHVLALAGWMPSSLEAAYTLSRIFPGKPGPADFLCYSAKPPWVSYYFTLPAAKAQRIGCWKLVSVTHPGLTSIKSFSSFSTLWPNFANSLSSVP